MRRSSAALVAAFTLLAVGACSGGDGEPEGLSTDDTSATDAPTGDPSADPDATPTGQPTSTAEASPTDEPEADPTSDEAILADYRSARDDYIAAYDPPNPDNPGLLEWHDGNALERYQKELKDLAAEGHSEIIEYDLHPEIAINEADTVIVKDCYDVGVTTVDTETGDQVGDTRSYTRNTNFSLEFREDQWVIVNFNHVESGCTPGG